MAKVKPVSSDTVIEKQRNSGFSGTNLESELRAREIENIVFVGIPLDHCVDATVRHASDFGFHCFVISDATVSFDRVTHEAITIAASDIHVRTLASLQQEFASILSTGELLHILAEPNAVNYLELEKSPK